MSKLFWTILGIGKKQQLWILGERTKIFFGNCPVSARLRRSTQGKPYRIGTVARFFSFHGVNPAVHRFRHICHGIPAYCERTGKWLTVFRQSNICGLAKGRPASGVSGVSQQIRLIRAGRVTIVVALRARGPAVLAGGSEFLMVWIRALLRAERTGGLQHNGSVKCDDHHG